MLESIETRLGRYEIRERIGRGATATVYKGWDTNLERWVAIKVMHPFLADEPDFRLRFEREAKLVAGLNHPNIVQVYDFDVAQGRDGPIYYMVMAYIDGQSLRRKLERKHELGERMTMFEISSVLRGVASALAYAHGRGMVHRDVTPGNILFNEQDQPVLADFGIARIVSSARLTQTGTTSGTPMYMAPEQGIGEGGDHRSDIYSLGVILFEMLVGQVPYEGDSAFSIMIKHVNDPIPSPLKYNPSLPQAIEVVIFRAMAKEPSARYQSAEELVREFERAAFAGSIDASTKLPVMTKVLVDPALKPPRAALPLWLMVAGAALVLAVVALLMLPRGSTNGGAPTLTLAIEPIKTRAFAPSMTRGPLLFTDTFEAERGQLLWPITTDDPEIYRNIENGVYRIWHRLPSTAVTTIFEEEAHSYATQHQYQADFTLSKVGQADSATGIVFRFRNNDMYYVFAVNGQGQVSLWRRSGEWVELRNQAVAWTSAEGVNPAGQKNTLRLVDNGRRLQGYVNDRLVIDVESEPQWLSGAIGVYLATTQSNVEKPFAEVEVDNFSVAEVKPSQTPTFKS